MRVKRFFQLYMDLISFACGIIVGALILIVFLDISAYKESLPFPWDAIGAVGTLLAAIIAVLTYRSSVKRQKMNLTSIERFIFLLFLIYLSIIIYKFIDFYVK